MITTNVFFLLLGWSSLVAAGPNALRHDRELEELMEANRMLQKGNTPYEFSRCYNTVEEEMSGDSNCPEGTKCVRYTANGLVEPDVGLRGNTCIALETSPPTTSPTENLPRSESPTTETPRTTAAPSESPSKSPAPSSTPSRMPSKSPAPSSSPSSTPSKSQAPSSSPSDAPSTSSPSVTPSNPPSSSPVPVPTPTPTDPPLYPCFTEREELDRAVASGVDWEDTNSFPYTSYGPIDQWCFDATLKDFSLLFDQKPVPDNINGWDVSNVENMYGIFREATFNGNISNWDVSKVKDFSFFFYGGNTPPTGDMLNGWDVSNAERMTWMFESTSFNGDVSSWNVSKVVSLTGMFKGSQFNGDLSNWDVSSVTSLVRLFELSKFNRNLSSWDVSSVRSFENTFRYSPFNYDISNWNVVSATKMIGMFNNAADFDKNLCDWGPRLSNLREVTAMFTSTKCPEEGDPDLEATPITPLCHICPAAESFSLSMFGWN